MSTRAFLIAGAAAGAVIALGQTDVVAFRSTGSEAGAFDAAADVAQPTGAIGPDVIVGALPSVHKWDTDDTETAYSIATTSCNIGDMDLNWIQSPSNEHPVIGQNLFRIDANGSFEQIGQSWLKHAFCALQQDLNGCGECPNTPGCLQHLEPGCSDPYTAQRNGGQAGLGPKWQVNASTGEYPVPWDQGEGTSGNFRRRLRVQNTDLDPALNEGARYFIEGQYVTLDDASWGNHANNASHREVELQPNWDFDVINSTVMRKPALFVWRNVVPGVIVQSFSIPDDGSYYYGYRARDNQDGTWLYEYVLHNLNSDRSGKAFSVPVGNAEIMDVEFHDVGYHSGEPWDGTDWEWTNEGGMLTWSTEDYETNDVANALRWGTSYTFRFTSTSPPQSAVTTLTLYKPGTPSTRDINMKGPMFDAPCVGDVDGDGAVGELDLTAVVTAWGVCAGCDEDVDGSGKVDFPDLLSVISNWGSCP